jgi:serine/threonine-protein kinase
VIEDDGSPTLADMAERISLKPMATLGGEEVLRTLGLVEGTLAPQVAEVVSRGDRVYERLVVSWLADLAQALQLAHDAGLAHAGLAPSSVVLDRHGVLDLRWLGRWDPGEHRLSRLAPEQVEAISPERVASIAAGEPLPAELRAASDLWSLGVLGWTLLTGRAPFTGVGGELIRSVATATIPAPETVAEGVSPGVGGAVMSALDRDPSHRPPTASAFAESLRAAAMQGDEQNGKKRFGLFGRKG